MSKGSETKTYLAACAQINVERGQVATNQKTALAAVRLAAERGAELVVLPELWPSSFVEAPDVTLIRESREAERELARLSGELGIIVIGGGLEEEKGRFFNRCCVVDSGKVLATYRKIHLFSPNNEQRLISPGEHPAVVDTRLGRIGVAICYDIRFPELIRYYFHQGVQVLVVPSQWPEARSDHWRTLTRARAIENQMFVVGCNRTGAEKSMRTDDTLVFPGDSRIVNPMGEVIGRGEGEDEPMLAEIELRRCKAMQRIMNIHRDRQRDVYRTLWQPLWENPDDPCQPDVPTIESAHPTEPPAKSGSND